jgi:lipopolysaccharide export system permease protein
VSTHTESSQAALAALTLKSSLPAWEDSEWVLTDARVRWFSEDGEVRDETYIARGPLGVLRDDPRDILREQKNPEEMSYRELRRLVRRIDESGGDPARYRVGLAMKLSFPFSNLIVVLIGAPLTAHLRRGGLAVGVGIGLGLAFVYYGLMKGGQALGDHAVLPPLVAAWTANAVFAFCGVLLTLRAEKT